MNKNRVIIIGAGGHGRVVADCLSLTDPSSEIVFVDDTYPDKKFSGSWKIIGRIDDLADLKENSKGVVVGIGDNNLRLELQRKAEALDFDILTVIHPTSAVSKRVELGEGTVVFANSIINIGTKIGQGTIINSGAIVEHDNVIGDGCHIGPGVKLAGTVKIGDLSLVGIGAVVLQNIKIDSNVIVGANSLVLRDVKKGAKVVGVPAKEI